MRVPALILSLAFCATAPLPVFADTLASYAQGAFTNSNANYLGEKFLTGGSGTYNTIVFNFITVANTAYAPGTAFLLTKAYTGAPGGLSSSTSGYLGSVAGTTLGNGTSFYDFAAGLTLQSATTYYLYENALVGENTISAGITAPAPYLDYYAASGGSFQADSGASDSFTVTGTRVSGVPTVPEPSSLVLLATGMIGAAGALRRRDRF